MEVEADEVDGGGTAGPVLLTHLPRLVNGHTPQLASHLPSFLLELALGTDWGAEKPCFHGVARALAHFYAAVPPLPPPPATSTSVDELEGEGDGGGGGGSGGGAAGAGGGLTDAEYEAARGAPGSLVWTVDKVLFPAFRTRLAMAPPRKLAREHYVVQLACTEQLYRIFERC
jgi:DNA mismatch repair protein MLH1